MPKKTPFKAAALSHLGRNKKRYAIGAAGIAGGTAVASKVGELIGRRRGASKNDPYYAANYGSGQKAYNSKTRRESAATYLIPAAVGTAGAGLIGSRAYRGYSKGVHNGRATGYDRGFKDAHKNRRRESDDISIDRSLKWGRKRSAILGGAALGATGFSAYYGQKAVRQKMAYDKKHKRKEEMIREAMKGDLIGKTGRVLNRDAKDYNTIDPKSVGGDKRYKNRVKWGSKQFSKGYDRQPGVRRARRLANGLMAGGTILGGGSLIAAGMMGTKRKEGLDEAGALGKAITWGGRGLAGLDLSLMGVHGAKAAVGKAKEKRQAKRDQQHAPVNQQESALDEIYIPRSKKGIAISGGTSAAIFGGLYALNRSRHKKHGKPGDPSPLKQTVGTHPYALMVNNAKRKRQESALDEIMRSRGRNHTRGKVLLGTGIAAGLAAPVAGIAAGGYLGNKAVKKWKERNEGLTEMSRGRAGLIGGGIAAAAGGVMAASTIKNKKSIDKWRERRKRQKQVKGAVTQGREQGRAIARGIIAMDKANRKGRKVHVVGKDFQARRMNADGTPQTPWMKSRKESAFSEDGLIERSRPSFGSRINSLPWGKADTALMGTSAGMGIQRRGRDAADDRRFNSSQHKIYDKRAFQRSSYDPLRRRQSQQYREA